ncbi:midasin isoform X2 [Diospyros lotus]|uniref:midasin isoform X2 n=1 Tax=Diospyros lotus TaxID=55363 RepID=UPI00225148CE|nr:midasin isoform X2 [Diospyros lotus]
MAFDPSFRIEFELERFLSRCPKLAPVSRLNSLLKEVHSLTEEEVVNAAAELFLLPNYTIPLVGCFRSIAQKIVERVVALLRLVPDLRANSDVSMDEFEEERILRETDNMDDAIGIIDFYVNSGRALKLHELACLALSRALDLAPFIMGSVLNYFKFAPPPFERIKLTESGSELSKMVQTHYLLNVVRASYRLLLACPEVFSSLWDWSCFLDLVQHYVDLDPGDNMELLKNVSDLRWCGIQILSVILKLNDGTTGNFGLTAEESFTCSLRWQEYCQDVSLEKAGWHLDSRDDENLDSANGNIDFSQEFNFWTSHAYSSSVSSSKFHESELSKRSRRLVPCLRTSTRSPFVLTSAMKKSFEMVCMAVSQKWPVLLYGSAGAGKTKLIRELAWDSGNQVLSIHMDEQMDGKTLVGSYVCTEQPGEFRWQPGSLTQAVRNGFWVVFEDIDKAPSDVQSILLPLLEGATTFLTGHGEAIRVAEGFQLFATISSSKLQISRTTEGRSSLSALWRRVMIRPPSDEDLMSIVKAWYPNLEPLSEKLIETYGRVNQLARFQFGNSASSNSLCRFSLRDLIKWCKRIAALGFSFEGNHLSDYTCHCIYQEAVDIFASSTTSVDNRLAIKKDIAKMWAVTVSAAETLYPVNKPVIQELHSDLSIGRVTLQRIQRHLHSERKPFVEIRSSVHVLEKIASSVKLNEPILLVGETGTGKTTLVQSLALRLGYKLTVLNLSQQSDIADLLGGFKPVNAQFVCIPLYKEFENLFTKSFSLKDNEDFLVRLKKFINDKNWKMLLSGFKKGVKKIIEIGKSGTGTKRKRPLGEKLLNAWEGFSLKLETAHAQMNSSGGMMFSFVEGAFITALRNGEWILLDEVNLAPPETLQRVIGVLEEENGSLCLAERGDVDYVYRHPDFRIFACMNPATDAGKRDLPYSLRSRFTEYFVDDILDDEDLILFIDRFMGDDCSKVELVKKVVRFYKAAKMESEDRLQDGANQKPQYSLRSLYRALEYANKARRKFGFQKALYDGFCMFFQTSLDEPSAKLMNQMIKSHLLGGSTPLHAPFDSYLVTCGNSRPDNFLENYVLTKSVKEHLRNLACAIFVGRYPVLLQGPTSSGKTSLVQYLASITGHEFVRINNHEHTDLQEYLGSYITDATGRLAFHEGVLVKAVRNGHWIVLDELNLAPSDVLEALNRLLDDNRELYIPELCETVRAHPDFMLFATQNPPTLYGGRKMLSRAFRNRFVEILVDEIPEVELTTILEKRCKIPESYAKKMVEVMKELQLHRQSSKVFAGKHGFITPRDLFRWADRFRTFGNSYEDLARDGYFLLAERLRDESEKIVVREVLEKQLRVKLAIDDLYNQEPAGRDAVLKLCKYPGVLQNLGKIVWTESMWRLYFLIERCYKMREPVLLVGETGGGKTTVCQLLSVVLGSGLHILNCHQYTETSDFLGGFYPVRERSRVALDFKNLCEQIMLSKAFVCFPGVDTISTDIGQASSIIDQLAVIVNSYKQGLVSHSDVTLQDLDLIEKLNLDLAQLHQKWQTIFIWQDGPLVQAMRKGDLFLVDEISLADDSVLERLNSVLEPERKLALAEKGGSDLEIITAHSNFFLLATMNPGGDYGKKELSPALRNRFTEIWVPPVNDLKELRTIALNRILYPNLLYIVDPMLNFLEWFDQLQTGRALTVRDLLSWIAFINATKESLQPEDALLHGAFLVLLDGLSLGTGISMSEAKELRERCMFFLLEQMTSSVVNSNLAPIKNYGWGGLDTFGDASYNNNMHGDGLFGIHPFYIPKGDDPCEVEQFEFLAPTTRRNVLRVLRAMQLPKPVLLEGSPGVGKTSLIVALGKFSGHSVVRINLSEQTDIMDLLGSDLPVESDEGLQFAWSDGILLQALKKGFWVLLDELNLAPQSVLEGLNAILDHRAEVFIPELGVTFRCPSSFRVFACQNPSYQGGGRKGLPKSFLNRFTKVYVDELVEDDYLFICSSIYPSIPRTLLSKLILFNKRLYEETMLYHKFAQDGSPWEFNLRDVFRSCQIIQDAPERSQTCCFLNVIYVQRMRTAADRRKVVNIYEEVFGLEPFFNPYPRVQLNSQYLVVGNTYVKRNSLQSSKTYVSELKILPGIRQSLEAAALCVHHRWLCIVVGPPSSGKTSLIRLLAQLTGNVLNELNLSSASDISELLGCFEQYNAFRHYELAITQVQSYVNEYCCLLLDSAGKEFVRDRKDLLTRWLAFSSNIGCSPTDIHSNTGNWKTKAFGSVPLLVDIIECLKLDLKQHKVPVSWSTSDLDKTLKTVLKLHEEYKRRAFSAKFEWVTGVLIKAIENGEWIVLENANLCNPTVLDRINSLVEPRGSITVNECGSVDGKPLVLHPHHQFRIFLTIDPSYGDVSRAMRNRGVEIYMMQPYWLDHGSGKSCDGSELKDAKRFLQLSGIPLGTVVDLMAKAHLYARVEGLCLDVNITFLELSRWVHLFQKLLTRGNQPLWSLQFSWEHTYLSSLGEVEGKAIVEHAKVAYLTRAELNKFESSPGYSLCQPGGWPAPLSLRDYIGHSKEALVKQNCMYLEFLGSQKASYTFHSAWDRSPVEQALYATRSAGPYLMDMKMLHVMMLPNSVHEITARYGGQTEFDLMLAEKKLLFAANWTIEQATANDIELYLIWFNWFASQLHPFCIFFSSFLRLLREELKHPIWNCIVHCQHELLSQLKLDLNSQPIPMLSMELVDLYPPNDMSKSCCEQLCKAINCVGLLRASFQQWQTESEYEYSDRDQCFIPFLRYLRKVEEKVLDVLVESSSFDLLFQLYTELLEDHLSFWNGINLSQFEMILIPWRSLMKNATKLKIFCPEEIEILQMEAENLSRGSSWHLHSQKSLLWVHGGHPFLPPSADLCQKQHQLLSLCGLIWPRNKESWRQAVNDHLIEAAVSSNAELRSLAMQGVSMTSYILDKVHDDKLHVVQQLDEMYKMLSERFEYEKQKLEAVIRNTKHAVSSINFTSCCVFSPDILHRRSAFDSWQGILPIIDNRSFLLDLELLQELLPIVLADMEGSQLATCSLSDLLESTLSFSLNLSSRPPTDFLPHQKILWTLDAWKSIKAGNAKLASFVLEMWFSWHSSLWVTQAVLLKNFFRDDDEKIPLPDMLFHPVRLATVDQILKNECAIKDYPVQCLKLRVASCSIWQTCSSSTNVQCSLLSMARFLFQQIIYAHRKSFESDKYIAIKSILCSFQNNMMMHDNIKELLSLLASSSHHGLASLVNSFIKPVISELYLPSSSTDLVYNLGCAWLRVGGLRYHLLITCDDLDPALKYSLKYSNLVQKIALLELENDVRKESNYLAGKVSQGEAEKQRMRSLENLKDECKRIKRKIVYRSDPGKFKKLKHECDEFLKLVGISVSMIKDFFRMTTREISERVRNWQETASRFIHQLSSEYSTYVDIVHPVQVAVYEMKLGLSLVLSSALQNNYLHRVGQDDVERVLEMVYSFMRFPRGFTSEAVSVNVKCWMANFPSCDIDFPMKIRTLDMNLLEDLLTSSTRDSSSENMVSSLQLKVSIHHNILLRMAHSVTDARLMDNASFTLMDKIFDEFANLWMNMKLKVKDKEDQEGQQYKFKPRAFEIQNIMEIDISTLGGSLANETLSEWQELLSEEDVPKKKAKEEDVCPEDGWNFMEEDSLPNDMVHIHNQLFGSMDLVQTPGIMHISEAERLSSFNHSYTLGVRMIKGLEGFLSSSLDAKLGPEHMFRVCLEHEQKFKSSAKSARAYNFYKDSNAPMMAKMMEPVTTLQQKIAYLSIEWDDHPALQKILDVIEMILAIPLSTPLAKALSSLQFLLNRIQVLQEMVSKFPLSDELEPIFNIVSSWKKLEFECWPALLDEVQGQFEINAGKLWFPLYSVLHHRHSTDISEYNRSSIQSLEDLIQTSNVGEFRKRLQLIFAFHGQIMAGISRGIYLSPCHMENAKILYNIFGFYVQHLPTILNHLENTRKSIGMELKELLKLCRWDRLETCASIENSRRTRQKFRKLIQKYTELLQQPIVLIIHQETLQRGIKSQSVSQGPKLLSDSFDRSREMLNLACDQALSEDKDSSAWSMDWRKKVDNALQNLYLDKTTESEFPYFTYEDAEVFKSIVSKSLASKTTCISYQEESKQVWHTLENICRTAIDCTYLWKDESKSIGKRRAFSDLLKLLESWGLSKHRSTSFEEQFESNQSNWWLLRPSYDRNHLLLTAESLDGEWKIVNQYYFKSMASFHLLQQICLNFHKDFTLEQVKRSSSFLGHLIVIQQEQREAAYGFAGRLSCLRNCASLFEHLISSPLAFDSNKISECCFALDQHFIFNCMWQQKQLFDSLCSMLHEECLLLKTVEVNHLDVCQSVKAAANRVRIFIEKFIPDFQKSKDLLDSYLVGHDRVVATSASASLHPIVVSKQMEQLVSQNFQMMKEFEVHLQAFRCQDEDKRSVKEILLSHFDDIFKKVKLVAEDYESSIRGRNESRVEDEGTSCHREENTELEAGFGVALKETYKHIVTAFDRIGSWNNGDVIAVESLGNITTWKTLFESHVANLQLDVICDAVVKAINYAGRLARHHGEGNHHLCLLVGVHLKYLHSLLVSLLNFGDCLLRDFLAIHKMVSVITHALADIFASLYCKGFGITNEDQLDNSSNNKTQDAKGTGMGEGAGLNDVSDQINDEDQLLEASEKLNEEKLDSGEVPGKNDKGIEMEQDFAADTFSVSEESGDDDGEDDQDEQLESAMGETGPNSEVIDERLQDKDDKENPNNIKEKYETGPAVNDSDSSGRELRAKEDSDSGAPADEDIELNARESDKQDNRDENQDGLDSLENMENVNMDREEAFAEPTGLDVDEPNEESVEDINVDGQEGADTMEDADPEELDESAENKNGEEDKTNSVDESMEEAEAEQVDGNPGRDDAGNTHKEEPEMDLSVPKKDLFEHSTSDITIGQGPNAESAMQPKGEWHASDLRDVAPEAVEANLSNASGIQDDLVPMRGLPRASDIEVAIPESSMSERISADGPQSQFPQHDYSSLQKIRPNPCRNVGDALDEWKERVRVTGDLQDNNIEEDPDNLADENADEYGYTSERDKGTAQALGPATHEQMDKNINGTKPDGDSKTVDREELTEMDVEKQDSAIRPTRNFASNLKKKIEKQAEIQYTEESPQDFLDDHSRNGSDQTMSESMVSLKRSYMTDDIHQLAELSLHDKELGKGHNLEEMSTDVKDNATAVWRRYELRTTRLSQELAEQLRLVMEPTLASKLQGDYKTGKRINMKKVIPYIASHYRKDKIWLRRTRPNKRDYQVVIVVDDSRSMSESHCGDVAIEALVTVCRAMSQLEVGNLAVASFGKKGNIRLLHEFDRPFTAEAGVKMISSFTFKQENTIADEPMVDLLKYVNNMLDAAVANARLPSGQNPLQQLVLIIADGRFHEKENLKRCVRDVLSRKRMVAFLLLDSPQESIIDLMEASFQGGNIKFSKYLDSFPFPFYVVLRHIEALPRTLADLLRQWFELMQNNRD